jgi:DNA-binding NtrC family response regulator/HAMP domain-containing protein
MPKTLKGTLILAIVALVVISVSAVTLLASHRYASSQEQLMAAQARNMGLTLANEITDLLLVNDLVAVQRKLEAYMENMPVMGYLFVLQEDRVMASTFEKGTPIGLIRANHTAENQEESLINIVSQDGEKFLDLAMPVFEGKAGVLRLGLSEKYLSMQLTNMWREIIFLGMAILIPALFIGLIMINRLTRPLAELAGAVKDIDPGHMEARIDVKGRNEVADLAEAFNLMTGRIREYTGKLENQTLELEKAHKKMQTTCEIARGVSALGNLPEIGQYLIERIKKIIPCPNYLLIIFGSDKQSLFLVAEDWNSQVRDLDLATMIESRMQGMGPVERFENEHVIRSDHFPEDFSGGTIQAAIPIYHDDTLCGVMLSSCQTGCDCDPESMDMISLVLSHSTGTIKRALNVEEEADRTPGKANEIPAFEGMVARHQKMQTLFRLIEDVAPTDATVLIQGESGTGKELVARAIHNKSLRAYKPFVVINCSAYPTTLLESELFGHEKGAFTGATRQRMGRFELADGGTVFLDEISEVEPSAQVKLLRVLQTQKFERLGGDKSIRVNVRILAATNKVLLDEVREGRFREDLYYRLDVVPVQLPPLRERGNDIALLTRFFLKNFAQEQSGKIEDISSSAMRALLDHDWPGNVRELENVMEQAVVLCKGKLITIENLPQRFHSKRSVKSRTINEQEKVLLLEALESCDWNKKMAAECLGIGRSTLYAKLKKHHIQDPAT